MIENWSITINSVSLILNSICQSILYLYVIAFITRKVYMSLTEKKENSKKETNKNSIFNCNKNIPDILSFFNPISFDEISSPKKEINNAKLEENNESDINENVRENKDNESVEKPALECDLLEKIN